LSDQDQDDDKIEQSIAYRDIPQLTDVNVDSRNFESLFSHWNLGND
jgi:hypothetical protein